MTEKPTESLPDWVDWDDHKRTRIIAFYRHWFLFDDKGKPLVIKRRKVKVTEDGKVRHLCDEEVCDLFGTSESMTKDARDTLMLNWGEFSGWRKSQQ